MTQTQNRTTISKESYLNAKAKLRTQMLYLLSGTENLSAPEIQEWVLDSIEYDEPQIAYTSLVGMIVNAGTPINRDKFLDIVQLGKELDITSGVTWNESDALEWWKKLEQLIPQQAQTTTCESATVDEEPKDESY